MNVETELKKGKQNKDKLHTTLIATSSPVSRKVAR